MDPSRPGAVARLWRFTRGVVRHFRASNGLLLASAVAYNALLSLIPFLLLVLIALLHLVEQQRLVALIRQDLRFIVPGQTDAVMAQIDTFLANRAVVGGVGMAALIFFSGIAFGVLENAMAMIFHHREARRHFLVSTILPYLFVLTLGAAMLLMALLTALLDTLGERSLRLLGWTIPLAGVGAAAIYAINLAGIVATTTALYMVMPVGRMALRHALAGGVTTTALWEGV